VILFLSYRMAMGFGVDVVVAELVRGLKSKGIRSVVGCIDKDQSYPDIESIACSGSLSDVLSLVDSLQPTHVVAHTTPFFEVLPELKAARPTLKIWAYEHGDPSPELFPGEEDKRWAIKNDKSSRVYPAIDGVIAISEFIRRDIAWPRAEIVFNGADNNPLAEPKNRTLKAPLRVGTLMRLGQGERPYKGGDLYLRVAELAREKSLPVEFAYLGRGSEDDARAFREQGFRVVLNASEAEKRDYLRGLDVFVSCSQWEGCNLPLLEAQRAGTLSWATLKGAHPEVCPFLFESPEIFVEQLRAYIDDPGLWGRHTHLSRSFVENRCRWRDAVDRFMTVLGVRGSQATLGTTRGLKLSTQIQLLRSRLNRYVEIYGWRVFLAKVLRRLWRGRI
jgi:glycosyltransferase involved in cell wall biosynthesis